MTQLRKTNLELSNRLANPPLLATTDTGEIKTHCPSQPPNRLPGYEMRCAECHAPHKPGAVLTELEGQKQKVDTCLGFLKYIGVAARAFAADHGGVLPADFMSMKSELKTPRVLFCQSDTNKQPPSAWGDFKGADASYQIVALNLMISSGTQQYVRCAIHDNALLADGTVVKGSESR